jgi:hypothetical protein
MRRTLVIEVLDETLREKGDVVLVKVSSQVSNAGSEEYKSPIIDMRL